MLHVTAYLWREDDTNVLMQFLISDFIHGSNGYLEFQGNTMEVQKEGTSIMIISCNKLKMHSIYLK